MKKPNRTTGGPNQVNVGFSDEDFQILRDYAQIKGLRTVQDAIRLMVKGAKGFVDRELKKLSKPAMTPPAPAVESPIAEPPVPIDVAVDTSDDGMQPPSVVRTADPDVDEDGEEISEGEKMRRARTQPAMDGTEVMRWASLKDEV